MTSAPVQPGHRFTLTEYLRFEESTEAKHEFHDGEILAMSGASPEHATITANLIGAIGNRLKGRPERIFSSHLKVGVFSSVFCPDCSIFCEALRFHPDDPGRHIAINPSVEMEVLSPTTEAFDRGAKFRHYREIPSLREYVLISQTSPQVETFFRQPDGVWRIDNPIIGVDTKWFIRTIETGFSLRDIYDGVTFPPPEPPPDPRERHFP